MTSSAKLNSPHSLFHPPDGKGGRYSTKFYMRRDSPEAQRLTLLNIYTIFDRKGIS